MALLVTFCCGFLFIYGVLSQDTCQRDAICAPESKVNPLQRRNINDTDEKVWRANGPTDPSPVGYLTDGYVVALSGLVDWQPLFDIEDLLMGAPSGGQVHDILGTIEGDFCPTYNAVFTTTNDHGLLCTIEVTQPVNKDENSTDYFCDIVLKSWSISLLYYRPEKESFFVVDNLQIFNGKDADPIDLQLRVMSNNDTEVEVLELSDLFHVQLDGITYIRAKALTFAYDSGEPADATTTPSPTPPVRRRMLQASDSASGMDYAASEIVTASGFLSSLPLSQIVLLGFCIGSSLFVGQILLSYFK